MAAATLIPLTPPSTHLVSITLELIVLIDRLLTLLRHRGELLELTSLRLQWDAMRWQIMQETAKVRSEIHDVARRKARWNPLAIRHDSRTFHRERSSTAASQASLDAATNGRMSRSSTIASVASVASGVSDLSDASILSRDPMGLPSPPRRGSFASMSSMSYRDLASPTKRSSQLPLLHSHIVNLEIRSRTLVSTSVSRSGKLLDKMIDVAIPLKNLGGIEGPIEEAKDTRGAVPDELLDIQDELEGQAGDLANRVTWCKLLEDQWKRYVATLPQMLILLRADEYHLSSIKAKDAAEAFLEDLQLIFSRPATSQQHTYLSQLLETAQSYLPEPLNQSFPRPEHADYPERQDHTARMEETLHQSRDEASELIQNCQDGLEWYGRILASSERLQGYGGDLKGKRDVLENALRVLARGTETSPRPSLAYPLSLVVETDEWLFVIDKTIRTVQISIDETSEANQRATLTVLKYRQASKSPHGSLRDDPTFEPTEQVADEVNSLTDDVTELLKRASAAINEARQDTDAVPKARAIILSSQEIIRSAESLESKLQWHKEVQGVKTIAKALEDLLIQHRQSVKRPIEDFAGLLRMQNRRVPTLTGYLADMSGSVKAHLADIQGMVTLQWRMAEQERSVEQIEKEAIRYIVKFAELGEQIGPIRKTPVESDLYEKFEGLSSEIESWQQNLVTRMIVLANGAQTPSAATATPSASMQASPLADATPRQTLLPSNTSAARPPMTPPASPPLTPRATDQPRLESSTQRSGSNRLSHARALELDNLTRSRINTASSRVASALDDVRVNITKVQKTRKETVTQKPPTIRSSSYSTRAVSPTVDVFGPLTNLSEPSITATASDQDNTLETLQKRLDDLHLDLILYPPTPLIQATPSLRHLPTPTSANTIKDGLASISLGVDKLLETSPHIEPISNLQMTLAASQAEIPRLDQLAEFTTAIRVCDETFSRLLYDLDENAMDRALLVSMRNSAGQAVKRSEEFASDLESDRRVTAEMKRVRRAWKDLDALVNETLNPDRLAEEDEINVDDPISDISSIAESVVSAVASTRRPVSAASNRRISSSSSSSLLPVPVRIRGLPATPGARPDRNRAASNPANATAFPPLSVTRDRAVSDTPSRSRAENLKGKGVPTFRRPSLDPITPQHVGSPAVRPGSNMSLHPRYSTNPASVVSSSIQTPSGTPDQTPRPRLSVGRSSRPRPPPRKAYIADPKNKLDVAVGKIVNKLNVSQHSSTSGANRIRWTFPSDQLVLMGVKNGKTCRGGTGSVPKDGRNCVFAGYYDREP